MQLAYWAELTIFFIALDYENQFQKEIEKKNT